MPSSVPSPSLPWKTRISIAAISAVTDFCRRSDGTMNRRLLALLDLKTSPNSNPICGVRTADVPIDPSLDVWIRLFVPTDPVSSNPTPILVYFHGGGFAYLSPASLLYDAFCRLISRKTGAVVASVNYRLIPEHRFPAQYDDGEAVLRFLDAGGLDAADPAAAAAADLSACFLAGDSAGGNIAHHVACRWGAGGKPARLGVVGIVAIQPFFGGEERTASEIRLSKGPIVTTPRADWMWKAFLPAGSDRDHEAVNVFGPKAGEKEQKGLPVSAMVVVGGFDPLQDWQRRYCEGLRKRGVDAKLVEFPEAIHCFYIFPEIADSGKLIDMIWDFILEHRRPTMAN